MLALLALVVVICFIEPRFMQIQVLLDILTQSSTRMIIALGICFTLLIAGTDLSAGRMVGLAAVVSTSMLQTATYANRFYPDLPQLPVFLPIIVAIIACMLFGTLNGFLVAKYDMHPFIANLGCPGYDLRCMFPVFRYASEQLPADRRYPSGLLRNRPDQAVW